MFALCWPLQVEKLLDGSSAVRSALDNPCFEREPCVRVHTRDHAWVLPAPGGGASLSVVVLQILYI